MNDRGAASIYGAIVGLVVVLLGVTVALRASRLIAEAEAQSAADFGALAGAAHAAAGEEPACARAEHIAGRNGAAVVSCLLNGLDLILTVQVREAEATARAGPIRSNVSSQPTGTALRNGTVSPASS